VSLDKPIDHVVEADLRQLIDNKVAEKKSVEYKQALPERSDGDRKEFLADVSSFANAAGGHLIYGMKEDAGVPVELVGLELENADASVSALDNAIRDGIRKRIPGVVVHPVPLESGRTAIVIRVPKSFASPHMVTFGGTSRFYSRNSNGKYQLDVEEIRSAFLLSDTIAQRIRDFRLDRIAKIEAADTPVPIAQGGRVVLHIVPMDAFSSPMRIDPQSIPSPSEKLPLAALNQSFGGDRRYNLEGLVRWAFSRDPACASAYLQIFRNGILETVDTSLLSPWRPKQDVPSVLFEEQIIKTVRNYVLSLQRMQIELPYALMLSLLGVAGYEMAFTQGLSFSAPQTFDRDVVLIPEVLIESFDCDISQLLKQPFDMVWNAAGWPRSMCYDEKGSRKKF
jgi:hypothetical protein